MAQGANTLLRFVRGLAARPQADEASDAALLNRFVSARDETAFGALVARHGPLVLHVCRRILGDVHEAEDAFQATFLILARKAATLRRADALPAWLHGVARRAALKARSARARRLREAGPLLALAKDPRPDPGADLSVRELLEIIDEELERLPERYRLPVMLCCLEGRSLEEAARQLGWTQGSVKGRLERGRAQLHARLLRRGLTLSAALAAAEASRSAAPAALVTGLFPATARSAVAFAAGQPAAAGEIPVAAVELAAQTLSGSGLGRRKFAAALLLVAGVLAGGWILHRVAAGTAPDKAQIRSAPVVDIRPSAVVDEPDFPIEVSGRVLDPKGKPLGGAKVYVGCSARRSAARVRPQELGYPCRMTTGADGHFHFLFARSELEPTYLDHSRPAVIAAAPGYGPAWADIKEWDRKRELDLKLVDDFPVDVRILDGQQPVAGATISVWEIADGSERELETVAQGQTCSPNGSGWIGSFPEQPLRVTTGPDGRCRLAGIGRERIVTLAWEGPGGQLNFFWAATRPRPAVDASGQPVPRSYDCLIPVSRRIRGVVRDKATGRPLADVKLSARHRTYAVTSTAFTDEAGAYEVSIYPSPPGWILRAQPEKGQPYFGALASLPYRPGPDPIVADFELVTGIVLQGRVTDQATGQSLKSAVVEYYPLSPNPHHSRLAVDRDMPASSCKVQPDGYYRLVVLPGPGAVCARASPQDWYATALVDDKELASLVKDGIQKIDGSGPSVRTAAGGFISVNRYHALALISPEEAPESLALDLPLLRARSITGTVVGPDGQPLSDVTVIGLEPLPGEVTLESATFAVRSLPLGGTRTLFFHHAARELGKTLTTRGDETEPLRVQLDPCGWVVGRVVDKAGKPVSGLGLGVGGKDGLPFAFPATDPGGRFRVALVPGRAYRLGAPPPRRLLQGREIEVTVESSQIKELGDLVLSD
jgi:RNA polymerase sigma factor (sigma-70 family)